MPCYKIPKANVPPPLTIHECDSFKHKIKQEKRLTYIDASKRSESLPNLHKAKNAYFGFFRDERGGDISREHRFTYDQIKDNTVFDPKSMQDPFHKEHNESIRKRCAKPHTTRWMVRSSQSYGWLPPLDDVKMGFGRSSVFTRDAMDVSHVSTSHATSALGALGV